MDRVSAFNYQMYISYCRGLTALKREIGKRKIREELRNIG